MTDQGRLRQLEEQKDGAYRERDRLVCALSKLFPASLERHPDSDTTWENDWRWIVFIDLPTGQATWHIHNSELGWFNHLPRHTGRQWDGHTTPEKYERLAALAAPTGSTPKCSCLGVAEDAYCSVHGAHVDRASAPVERPAVAEKHEHTPVGTRIFVHDRNNPSKGWPCVMGEDGTYIPLDYIDAPASTRSAGRG